MCCERFWFTLYDVSILILSSNNAGPALRRAWDKANDISSLVRSRRPQGAVAKDRSRALFEFRRASLIRWVVHYSLAEKQDDLLVSLDEF